MLDKSIRILEAMRPAVLHGLRTTAAASIALGIAFWLELDRAYWAGTTAVIVCQPLLGSSLRKAFFRALGTLAGALAIVLLSACFPQDRIGFSMRLAGWCAICGFVGHRLTLFAAYGAQLAGITAAIVAGDIINQPDIVFDTVLARVSEIEIGIAAATFVLATTQKSGARLRLATQLTTLATDALAALRSATPVADAGSGVSELSALDPVIDQVTGESALWRMHLGPVRAAQNGLFDCLARARLLRPANSHAGWRELLPAVASSANCHATAKALSSSPDRDAAEAVIAITGIATALDVAAWLTAPERPVPQPGQSCPAPADPLPALITAARVYSGVAVACVIWMATGWPNGPGAITWTAILTLLMSPRQEEGFSAAFQFGAGVALSAILAAIVNFAVLPQIQSFWALSACLGLVLVPMSALSTMPRLAAVLVPAAVNFLPLVAPANQENYDPAAFYNAALSIVFGCGLAIVALRVVAPISAPTRTRRILAAAEADRSSVVRGTWRPTARAWCDRMRTRLASLPSSADPETTGQLLLMFGQGASALDAGNARG